MVIDKPDNSQYLPLFASQLNLQFEKATGRCRNREFPVINYYSKVQQVPSQRIRELLEVGWKIITFSNASGLVVKLKRFSGTTFQSKFRERNNL